MNKTLLCALTVICIGAFSILWHQEKGELEIQQTHKLFINVTEKSLQGIETSSNSMDVVSADIDMDGDFDLIIAKEFEENQILVNNGTGMFSDESDSRISKNRHDSEHIAAKDFDNDGDLDLIFVSEDDKTNEYYINDGKGYFTLSKALDKFAPGVSNVVVSFDVNLDGYWDILIGNKGANMILVNDGKGNFANETSKRIRMNNETTQDIEIGDIDNDGDLDIVEGNENQSMIYINYGKGYFRNETAIRMPKAIFQTREVELGDIDNDGDLDIFLANVDFDGYGNPQNQIFENNGDAFFTNVTDKWLPKSNFKTVGAIFYDINDDGFLDLLNGNWFEGSETIVLINTGSKFIDATKEYLLDNINMYLFDIEVQDFNGDGLNDVYFANFRGEDVLMFQRKK